MAFSYSSSLESDLDRVRFAIGDVTRSTGPKPDGANFSDEEIEALLVTEGSVDGAAAALFEALLALWSGHVSFTADGVQVSTSHIADRYERQATAMRERSGTGGSGRRASAMALTRQDAYSDDLDSVE